MPRARNKDDLILFSKTNYDLLLKMISEMSENQLNTPFDFSGCPNAKEAHWSRDKNVRDILIHLYEWQKLLLVFIKNNLNEKKVSLGNKIAFLPPEYSWKTYGEMNVQFWKKHQETSLETAKNQFEKSHSEIMELIETFSNEELFTKKYFDFTGTTDLGSYFVSTTSSHYDWAIKKIKLHCKRIK